VLGLDYQRNTQQDQINYDAGTSTRCYAIASTLPCLDSRASGSRLGLFAQDDITLRENLKFSTSLRYDRSNIVQGRMSPRLGIIYNPWQSSALKLLYGSAFRSPNAYELNYSFPGAFSQIGNPELKPEVIRTTEAAWEQFLVNDTRIQASVYYYQINDWIVQVPTSSGALQFQNQPEVKGKGLEFEVEHQFADGAHLRTSISAQFVPEHPNGALNGAPRHLAKANYSIPMFGSNAWHTGIEAQYVGRRPTPEGSIGSYTLANATVLWQPRAKGQGPELTFSAYNLFDKRYQEVFPDASLTSGVPRETLAQDGRSWRLKYLYRF
jgi:iron complex outermembrane receptor protein